MLNLNSCRVVRLGQWGCYDVQNFFLRVHFKDEDMSNIRSKDQAVLDRISEVMNKGLQIYGRTYQLLAYSNSQLRQVTRGNAP